MKPQLAAVKKPEQSVRMMRQMASARAAQRSSMVRAAAFLSKTFSLAKAISIGMSRR
jgi:hypothetical protein